MKKPEVGSPFMALFVPQRIKTRLSADNGADSSVKMGKLWHNPVICGVLPPAQTLRTSARGWTRPSTFEASAPIHFSSTVA